MKNKKNIFGILEEKMTLVDFNFLVHGQIIISLGLKIKFKTLLVKYEDLEKDCYLTSHKLIEFILLLKGQKKWLTKINSLNL